MKSKFKNFTEKPFVRNVIIMATGTVAAQLVNILLQPIITRLYGPEAYGLMGTFMAIVAMIAPISALTYPIAIVLPKSDTAAKGLIKLSMYIATGIALSVSIILIFFHGTIVQMFQLESIAPYLYLLPLVILSAGFLQVIEQWLIRTKQFGITAKVSFFQAIILNGGKVGIGIFHPVAGVLIILSALGNGLKAFMMVLMAKKSDYIERTEENEDELSIKKLGKIHRDFPKFRAPEVFLNAASHGLPVLMLTSFFGPASAGFYSIGRTVLQLPTLLIGKSVGDVFYPRISEAAHSGENLTKLIRKATVALGLIGFIPFALIFAFGPWLFNFVFGSEWVTAGVYARWMALGIFFAFMNKPSVIALPVLAAQAFHLKYTIFILIIRISALVIGFYLFESDIVAMAFFGMSGAILNIGLILITLRISKRYDR